MPGAAVLTRRRREEAGTEGFTLIELVLTVALLGLISAAIVSSFLVMLTTKEQTSESLDASRDQQFLATFFTDDVAGLRSASAGTQTVCGTSQSTVVVFTGLDFVPSSSSSSSTAPVATTVAWVHRPATGDLVRIACRAGGTPDTRVLARDVPTTPTISGSCTAATALGSTPTEVSMTVGSTAGTSTALCGKRRSDDVATQTE